MALAFNAKNQIKILQYKHWILKKVILSVQIYNKYADKTIVRIIVHIEVFVIMENVSV